MEITSKSIDGKIMVYIGTNRVGEISGTEGKYIIVAGENGMRWKIEYNKFV